MKRCRRHLSHFPVAIVGGGPSGMILSALLSQYGVKHALIERRKNPANHPQAHFVNMRSMEILQGHLPEGFVSAVNAAMHSDNWRYLVLDELIYLFINITTEIINDGTILTETLYIVGLFLVKSLFE